MTAPRLAATSARPHPKLGAQPTHSRSGPCSSGCSDQSSYKPLLWNHFRKRRFVSNARASSIGSYVHSNNVNADDFVILWTINPYLRFTIGAVSQSKYVLAASAWDSSAAVKLF
jgi:hypothetical protein